MVNFEITLDDSFAASWADDVIEAICDYCANKNSARFYASLLFALFDDVNLNAIKENFPEMYKILIALIDERTNETE